MRRFRNNGTIGAILDEYEKAILELEKVLSDVTDEELKEIVDKETNNSDCKSIQTILTHLIRAGYIYVNEVRKLMGEHIEYTERKIFKSVAEYQNELKKMFKYNEKLFSDYPNIQLEETATNKKILTQWNQHYDVEQLFEHAIVHILKHRRQIEKFKIIMAKKPANNIGYSK